MAYSEVATSIGSPDAVINQIVTFATANGWIADRNELSGSNRTATVHKSGSFIHLWNTDANNLRVIASTAFQDGVAPDSHTSKSPFEARANIKAGPYAKLYLFASNSPSEHLHAQIEMQSGLFRLVSFGEIEKVDAFTGGTYFDATFWYEETNVPSFRNTLTNTSHTCFDSDSTSAGSWRGGIRALADTIEWARFFSSSTTGQNRARTGLYSGQFNSGGGEGYLTSLHVLDVNTFDNRRVGFPIRVDVSRPNSLYSPLGTIPGIRYIRIDTLSPTQEVQDVDTLVWKMFPFVRKGTSPTNAAEDYSGWHGYAIQKTT